MAACSVSVSAIGVPSAACREKSGMPFGKPSIIGKHLQRLVGRQCLDVRDLAAAKTRKLKLAHDGRYDMIGL